MLSNGRNEFLSRGHTGVARAGQEDPYATATYTTQEFAFSVITY
jgi:hypothetical protein